MTPVLTRAQIDLDTGLAAYARGHHGIAAVRLERAAEAGDAEAAYALGLMRQVGLGGPRDPVEAGVLLARAGFLGHAEARRDYVAATATLRVDVQPLLDRAVHGDAEAMRELAGLHAMGLGTPRDSAEAAKWAHLAADHGDTIAQTQLERFRSVLDEDLLQEGRRRADAWRQGESK